MQYPWYEKISPSDNLQQGDIFKDCSITVPDYSVEGPKKDETVQGSILVYDVIVVSQSCDLVQDKLKLVQVCPFYPLSIICEKAGMSKKAEKTFSESLRKGQVIHNHLLNKEEVKSEFLPDDYLVVDFRSLFGVPLKYLTAKAASVDRLRLLPPYREHLAQAFARSFMRVGLPIDIPSFT